MESAEVFLAAAQGLFLLTLIVLPMDVLYLLNAVWFVWTAIWTPVALVFALAILVLALRQGRDAFSWRTAGAAVLGFLVFGWGSVLLLFWPGSG